MIPITIGIRLIPTTLKESQRLLQATDRNAEPPLAANATNDLTRLIWALGGMGSRRAVPTLCAIGGKLPRGNAERYRAVAVPLGRIADPAAAPALARILQASPRPAFRRRADAPPAGGDLEQLFAAVALYRCGDRDSLARQKLEQFAVGDNGPFAELAIQVLRDKPGKAAPR